VFNIHGVGKDIALLTEWPELSAISLRLEKTKGTVRAFGLNSVFCMFLEFLVTHSANSRGATQGKIISYHCDQAKVSLLFQVGFDELETSSRGLAYRFDKEALSDSQLDARVIRTQLPTDHNQPGE
jgi:hypothetical protein